MESNVKGTDYRTDDNVDQDEDVTVQIKEKVTVKNVEVSGKDVAQNKILETSDLVYNDEGCVTLDKDLDVVAEIKEEGL